MRITKQQLRRIILEEVSSPGVGDTIDFEWSPSGLAMKMLVNGNEVTQFSTQKEVSNLISQLEKLLAGPMRTSP